MSGEGARHHGGRFNVPGTPAFYTSLDPHTAYAEYTQNLFDRPGLLCSFDVGNGRIADLRGAGAAEWRLTEPMMSERWVGRCDAPTQLAATEMQGAGFDGAIYASLQHRAGANLVLWRWNDGQGPRITLRDRLGEAAVGRT